MNDLNKWDLYIILSYCGSLFLLPRITSTQYQIPQWICCPWMNVAPLEKINCSSRLIPSCWAVNQSPSKKLNSYRDFPEAHKTPSPVFYRSVALHSWRWSFITRKLLRTPRESRRNILIVHRRITFDINWQCPSVFVVSHSTLSEEQNPCSVIFGLSLSLSEGPSYRLRAHWC